MSGFTRLAAAAMTIALIAAACAADSDPEGASPNVVDPPDSQSTAEETPESSTSTLPESTPPTTGRPEPICPAAIIEEIGDFVVAQITTAEGESGLLICDQRSGDISPVLVGDGEFQSNNVVVVVPNEDDSVVVLSVATPSGQRVAVYEVSTGIEPLFATLLSDGSDGETTGLVCSEAEGVSLRRIQLSAPGEIATASYSIEYADGRRESGELDLATQFPDAFEMITTRCGDMFPGRSQFANSLGQEMLRAAGLDDVGGDHPSDPIAALNGNWNRQPYQFCFDLQRSDLVFRMEIRFDWVGDCGPGRVGIRPSPPEELLDALSEVADCHEV